MRLKTRRERGLFFQWGLLPVIFALAWPTMLEQLMGTAVQYIDTAMVGSLGTRATAAVGSTSTVSWLVGSTVSAVGVGFLACISQACGAGDKEKAARASAQAVLAVLVTGLFFTVVTLALSPLVPRWMQVDEDVQALASRYFFIVYLPMLPRTAMIIFGTVLRAAGDTKTPMRAGILVNAINVVLNFLLIYPSRRIFGVPVWGADLGVIGAAAASAVSFLAGGLVMTTVLWRHPEVSPRGRSLKPDGTILKPCLKIALPNMAQRFCTSLGYVVFASMINSLGGIATAAHTVANTVESAFYVPGYGMMTAAATLTGNCIGAGDEERRRAMSRMIVLSETAMMILSGGLLFFFARPMTMLFSADEQVITLCSRVLRMVALSEPFYGISIVLEGMLMGAGETRRPFVFSVGAMWGVRIFGTFLCVNLFGLGLVSAWACMIAGNMTLMVLFAVFYLRGNWQKAVA